MTLQPSARKALLVAHVVSSVGWLGAVVAFLALAIAAFVTGSEQSLRAMYVAMEVLGWAVLVPLALASFTTGVVQALLTQWGLLQHWWVVVKLGLTVVATGVLLAYTGTLGYLANEAARPGAHSATLPSPSPILHSAAALAVLLGAAILSVYKPRGLTRRGWHKLQERQRLALMQLRRHEPTDRPR